MNNHEYNTLLDKQRAGAKLSTAEIRALMHYALDILKEFERETKASIARAHDAVAKQFKQAA